MPTKKAHLKASWLSDGLDSISAAANSIAIPVKLCCRLLALGCQPLIRLLGPKADSSRPIVLLNHSLKRDADVLDPAVLYAQRDACFAVKPSLGGFRDQLCQCRFDLLDLIQLRRSLYSCLNHGVTISREHLDTIRDFWPPSIFRQRMQKTLRNSGIDHIGTNETKTTQIVSFLLLTACLCG